MNGKPCQGSPPQFPRAGVGSGVRFARHKHATIRLDFVTTVVAGVEVAKIASAQATDVTDGQEVSFRPRGSAGGDVPCLNGLGIPIAPGCRHSGCYARPGRDVACARAPVLCDWRECGRAMKGLQLPTCYPWADVLSGSLQQHSAR